MVYFDQSRQLDPDLTLRRALAPDSDAVIYQGSVIHVAAWAARFLFDPEDLNQRVGKLSGGERARVLISQLMLQEADVLLLDEPTNDLDIPTLEILEESLLEFTGALLLVTHDRYLLDRVSTIVLGLDGRGGAERFADYSQWDAWQRKQTSARGKLSKGLSKGPSQGRTGRAGGFERYARMLMHNSRQRPQPSENFLTRRRGNLPTSKITWYKRSPSFPARARRWPIPSWQVTGSDYWKPASGWKKLNTKWNDFMHAGRNWPRKRNKPRSEGIIAIG